MRLRVVPVGIDPEVASATFTEGVARLDRWSNGARPVEWQLAEAVERPEGRWHRHGGMAANRPNSRDLAESIWPTGPMARGDVRVGDETPMVAIVEGLRPHHWHLDGRRRSYAVLPPDAPAAVVAHELGHLIWGWPDHALGSPIGEVCLMGPGAHQGWGPCLPLRIAAGWEAPVPWPARARINELRQPVRWAYRDGVYVGEVRAGELLVFRLDPPALIVRVPVAQIEGDGPVLGWVAVFCRRDGSR